MNDDVGLRWSSAEDLRRDGEPARYQRCVAIARSPRSVARVIVVPRLARLQNATCGRWQEPRSYPDPALLRHTLMHAPADERRAGARPSHRGDTEEEGMV